MLPSILETAYFDWLSPSYDRVEADRECRPAASASGDMAPDPDLQMKISAGEAASLIAKYVTEEIHVAATLHTTAAQARVRGFVRHWDFGGVPGLLVGGADRDSNCIVFRLADCEYKYGDLREAGPDTTQPHQGAIEGFLLIKSVSAHEVLMISEGRSRPAR